MPKFLGRINDIRNNVPLRTKWLEGALCLFAVLLPFQSEIFHVTYALLIYGLIWAFWFHPKEYFLRLKRSKYFLLITVYYLWLIAGTFYSDLPDDGWRLVVLRITLWLWPLGIVSLGGLEIKSITKISVYFLHALAISALVGLTLATSEYLETGSYSAFYYKNLVYNEMVPSHYFALYLSFGILIALNQVLRKAGSAWMKIIYALEILLFLSFIAMLSVRIQFVALPLALATYFLVFNLNSRRKIKWKYVTATILVLILAVLSFSGPRKRIAETFDELASINGVKNKKQTNHRVFIWKYGIESIAEAPVFGHGTGEADEVLFQKLKTCDAQFWQGTKPYYLWEMRYNYHNTFLQEWASNGLFGLALFLTLLVMLFIQSYQHGNYMAVAWLVLCLVSFLTESMLDRQAGVLFFGFFYWVFALNTGADSTTNIKVKSATP